MREYKKVQFNNINEEQSSILIAALNDLGYEGFEEEETQLNAFIEARMFNEAGLSVLPFISGIEYTVTGIAETNWNAVWESNFPPVIVDDFAAIRADFHTPISDVKHEIVITPKMSFGTGHHATTHLMIQQMRHIPIAGKTVFDFGTGTGVLAILAEKLGASSILAVDNDDWSIENTTENIAKNKCEFVKVVKANDANTGERFDVILANINRNVLLDNMGLLKKQLNTNGQLLMSGLLLEDETVIKNAAEKEGLQFVQTWQRNGWICMLFNA